MAVRAKATRTKVFILLVLQEAEVSVKKHEHTDVKYKKEKPKCQEIYLTEGGKESAKTDGGGLSSDVPEKVWAQYGTSRPFISVDHVLSNVSIR